MKISLIFNLENRRCWYLATNREQCYTLFILVNMTKFNVTKPFISLSSIWDPLIAPFDESILNQARYYRITGYNYQEHAVNEESLSKATQSFD